MYLLDANLFIEAKNTYYRFDIFPGFWDWLDLEQAGKRIASIDIICDELTVGTDELSSWAKARRSTDWFMAVDDQLTQQNFTRISDWVVAQGFTPQAKSDFLDGGDPWLIAKAMTIGGTVVTQETYSTDGKRRVKIPNVCHAFNIPYVDTFEMLRNLGAKF